MIFKNDQNKYINIYLRQIYLEKECTFKMTNINKGISYVNDSIISDKDIIESIGIISYSKIQNMFPEYFSFFKECKLNDNPIGVIPSDINLQLEYEGIDLKREIIFCMLNEDYVSSVRFLIKSSNSNKVIISNCESFSIFWILICFTNLLLLIFCSILLYTKNKNIYCVIK